MRASMLATIRRVCTALLLAALGQAHADEVRVFAAGAAKHAVEALAPGFEQATGHRIRAEYDTVGALRDRVLQAPPGAAADVLILSEAALQSLRAASRLTHEAPHRIGHVVVALAVPPGSPVPDLSNAVLLRQALLDAPSIAYADPARGATAGTHFARVLDGLGLREAVQAKTTVLSFGVDVIRAVADRRFALGVSQSSEIMQAPGVQFAGALPAPWALSTAYGAALAGTGAPARQWMDYLQSAVAVRAFRASGFVPGP